MATIGQALTAPESSWRRYDDADSRIKYTGFTRGSVSTGYYYKDTCMASISSGSKIEFKFYGSKIRLISTLYTDRSDSISISIDGVTETYNEYNSSALYQRLVYEKTGLTLGSHSVVITNNKTSAFGLDAIDIDDAGHLVHPILNQISSFDNMNVGDCIPCRYTALTSGLAGYFSEVGTCVKDEIPVTGSATPDGLFYFIKTEKGTLIADRVIQTNISWDTLNAAKLIEGSKYGYLVTDGIIATAFHPAAYSPDIKYTLARSVALWQGIADNPMSAAIYDLGKVTQISKIILNTMNSTAYTKSLDVYGSNDNVNWVKINSFALTSGDNIININSSYRYFKLTNAYRSDNRYVNTIDYILFVYANYDDLPLINKTLIRSLSGGCAYADANGNKTFTYANKGAWPLNNEWDKYVVNSDLNGKIVAGADNIWHYQKSGTWCKETTVNGTWNDGLGHTSTGGTNTSRIIRGNTDGVNSWINVNFGTSSVSGASYGFRPLLNYIETDIKNEVIY